jgi:hypothetical protein
MSVIVLVPLLACATGTGGRDDPEIEALVAVPDTVYLVIKNRYRLDLNVHAMFGGSRQFLGVVTTNRNAEFAVRGTMAASTQFRIAVDAIGSNVVYATEELLVERGDVVEVTFQYPLSQTYWNIY